jgi:hypothetical protein
MEAAHIIRDCVAQVTALRESTAAQAGLREAAHAVKRFQAQRFGGTYADLLASKTFSGATRFFLVELYSEKDYSARDSQFARIAGALESFFPKQVVGTAVAMAQLHALTEELDYQMAKAWQASSFTGNGQEFGRYLASWDAVGRQADRSQQLEVVLQVGQELERLTRKPGLRTMLRMMRKPASLAGLAALQSFLEAGFDTFADMAGKRSTVSEFLGTIRQRESAWIERLFAADRVTCETELRLCLGKAP